MRDEAATNPLSFVVAGSLIIATIGIALVATDNIGSPAASSSSLAANRQSQADGLLSLLVDAPPVRDPVTNDMTRLSLREDANGNLDISTFRTLQLTRYTQNAADLLYYDDARDQLGVSSLDFHIRSYPTLQSVRDQLGNTKDPNLEVVYIGHVEKDFGGNAPQILSAVCSASPIDSTDTTRYTVEVKNTGTTPTMFQAVLTIDNGPGKALTVRDQSGVIGNGNTGTITLDVPNTAAARCSADTAANVVLYGLNNKLAEKLFDPPTGSGAATTLTNGLPIFLREMYYHSSDTVTVEYDAAKDSVLAWKLYAGTDTAAAAIMSDMHVVPPKGTAFTFTAPAVASITGYTLVVKQQYTGYDATTSQRLVVAPTGVDVSSFTPQGAANVVLDPAFEVEVDMIDQLIERFSPKTFDGTVLPDYDWPGNMGDVYWDQKQILTDSLPDRIDVDSTVACNPTTTSTEQPYPDIIVVGSNVDHHAMTSGGFKLPLADWVVCGGLLIVFGSPDAATQWLQPIFHVGAQTSTGGVSAPDTTHPLLRVPHVLDFEAYDNEGRTWKYTGNAGDHFTNIVNQGGAPITAISDPGDFGRGTVLISNWLPYDLFGDGSAPEEGLNIMDNFLTQAYRDLFLDYGPPLPQGEAAVPAIRQAQIELSPTLSDPNYHPMCKNTSNCHVDMTVLLYLF